MISYDECLLYDDDCLLWWLSAMTMIFCDMIVCYDYDCLLYNCLLWSPWVSAIWWWLSAIILSAMTTDECLKWWLSAWYDDDCLLYDCLLYDCLLWWWLSAMMMTVCYDCLLYNCLLYNCLLWRLSAMMIVCYDDCLLWWLSACEFVGCIPSASPLFALTEDLWTVKASWSDQWEKRSVTSLSSGWSRTL